MNKYNVGDKVVIRKDLIVGEFYGDIYWWTKMDHLKEKDYVVIERVDEDGDYNINGGWCITDEMIAGLYVENGEVDEINDLKLFEVTYFDEHQVLKVTTDKY